MGLFSLTNVGIADCTVILQHSCSILRMLD